MMSPQLEAEVRARISIARIGRCGMKPWIPPPSDWPAIVQAAWPTQWYLAPHGLPDGLVDLVMSMADHVGGVDASARFHAPFVGTLDGGLSVRCTFAIEAVRDIVTAYEHVSRTACGICGHDGLPVDYGAGRSQVFIRCAAHTGDIDD